MSKDTIRTLSAEEMALVCGGTTMATVTAYGSYDDWHDPAWYDPDYGDMTSYGDDGGGGGGGGYDDTAQQQLEILGQTFIQIAELYKTGTGISGTIFAAMNYANLSESTAQLTVQWALRDIGFFRDTGGMHVPSAQGSLIPWQNLQIDWAQYDNGGTPEDVLRNFLDSLD